MNNSLHQQELDLDSKNNQTYSPLQAHSIMGSNPVSVCCRLKPILFNEEKSNIHVDMKDHAIIISEDSKQITKTFAFDQIFDQTVCQHKFTRTICDPLIQFLKNDGNGGLIFSYGVTNSGKTHSILGNIENPGVLYYLIKKLQDQFGNGSVKITAFQLYNDEFFSLKNKEKMTPKEFCGFLEFDQYEPDVIQAENMETILKQYMSNRSQGDTKFNPKSSRSHAIFKIQCNNFKIGVVDLAGSQRAKGGPGQKINQTIAINKSLLLLGRCIQALKDKKKNPNIRIPFRESKLTQVLMEYFTTGYKIRIIANVNQAKAFYYENIQVLEYTSIAKNITNNCSSQFAQAVKSARKKYELIKSNFKSQKQKSNIKTEKNVKTNYKAKITIDQQDLVINEETFQNEQRDTEFRTLLILSEKKKIDQLQQIKQLQEQKKIKKMTKAKSNDFLEDIHVTQRAFSMFLDFQKEKQAQQDKKFLSNLKKVNFFQSQRKNDKLTQTGINTIDEQKNFFQCDIDKLATGIKKKLRQHFQNQRKQSIIAQDAQIQTYSNLKKEFTTPKKPSQIIETQKIQECDQLLYQKELSQLEEVSENTEMSQQDVGFLNSVYNVVDDAFKSGRKIYDDLCDGFKSKLKDIKEMPNIIKNNSYIKQRKTNLKARKFQFCKTNQLTVFNQQKQKEEEKNSQEQKENEHNVQQIQFRQVQEREEENTGLVKKQSKIFNDQATTAVVLIQDASTQTDFFQPQKPYVKFTVPDHQTKKNLSNKKSFEHSVDRKKILKNKTPMKYNPPTPIAKRTRHIRHK